MARTKLRDNVGVVQPACSTSQVAWLRRNANNACEYSLVVGVTVCLLASTPLQKATC